jgi:hypothetical protein
MYRLSTGNFPTFANIISFDCLFNKEANFSPSQILSLKIGSNSISWIYFHTHHIELQNLIPLVDNHSKYKNNNFERINLNLSIKSIVWDDHKSGNRGTKYKGR